MMKHSKIVVLAYSLARTTRGEGRRGEGEREEGGRGGRGRGREGGGGGGRGGVMPKRLKSGSGHHRLKICGPSNGRHKIA